MAPSLWTKMDASLWNWVGASVTSPDMIQPIHLQQVYALTSTSGKPFCGNPFSSDNQEERLGELAVTREDAGEKTTSKGRPKAKGSTRGCGAKCRENPNCLNKLGQEKWEDEEAFYEYKKSLKSLAYDPSCDAREEDIPVGLKNLGATCYVNTLIQVWYHNLEFRRTVYACEYEQNLYKEFENSPLFQLQLVFGALQGTKETVYNPIALVDSLGLKSNEQQDAQEFATLFMSKLEEIFYTQRNETARSFIKNEFTGTMAYSTKCKNCRKGSLSNVPFTALELALQGNSTLEDCIADLLKSELLDGANRYLCPTCHSMQNAERSLLLRELPPVLNFQLLRFVYDAVSLSKKKLKHSIRFPETIDLSRFVTSDMQPSEHSSGSHASEYIYDLTAVLIHNGPSAYSGHYIANVYDRGKKCWFRFDDEAVTKLKDKEFDEDPGDGDERGKSTPKKKKSNELASQAKGKNTGKDLQLFSSRNAYSLFYTRRGHGNDEVPIVPSLVESAVQKMNNEFEDRIQEYQKLNEIAKNRFMQQHAERKSIYSIWDVKTDQEFSYYLSSEAIQKWLKAESIDIDPNLQVFDNSSLVCEHDRLSPVEFLHGKRINKLAGDLLLNQYGCRFQPSLSSNDLCLECVRRIFREKYYGLTHEQHISRFDQICKAAKQKRDEDKYWISTAWLLDWKKKNPSFHDQNATDPPPNSEPYYRDVICEHGELSIKVDKSKSEISRSAYEYLQTLFPGFSSLSCSTSECSICSEDHEMAMEETKGVREQAQSEKNELKNLMALSRRIPSLPNQPLYLVAKVFIENWREFVKQPTLFPRPEYVDNSSLICESHQKTIYDPTKKDDRDEDQFEIVTNDEWEILLSTYNGGPEITFTMIDAMDVDDGVDGLLKSEEGDKYIMQPSLCGECRLKRKLDFTETTLYVRKVSKAYIEGQILAKEGSTSQEISSDGQMTPPKINVSHSSSSTLGSSPSKRGRPPLATASNGSARKRKTVTTMEYTGTRSSKRLRDQANGVKGMSNTKYKLSVGKQTTVKDIKVMIMRKLNVSPIYQTLYCDGKEWSNNDATVAELGVLLNTNIDLLVFDEGEEKDFEVWEDPAQIKQMEDGFKGTGLLTNGSFPQRNNETIQLYSDTF